MTRFSFRARLSAITALAGAAILAASPVFAGPRCTDEPKTAWLTEEAMKAKIAAMGYTDIRTFKVTAG